MSPSPRLPGIRPALVALALTVALTGCSASSDDAEGSQPIAEACAGVSTRVDAAMTAFADGDAAEPAAAADALAAVVDGLGDASRSIDNAELEKTVTKLHDGFATLSDAVDAAASGDITGVAGLATATEDIRAAGAEFARLCSD